MKNLSLSILTISASFLITGQLLAQQVDPGGGDQGPVVVDGGDDGTINAQGAAPPDPTEFDPSQNLDIEPAENLRFNGFVGFSSSGFEDNEFLFIGQTSEGGDGGFGDGLNDQGGGNRAATGGRGGQGFQSVGGQNNFIVTRNTFVRARVVPNFVSRIVPDSAVSSRFTNRLGRLPLTQQQAPKVRVMVKDQVATITGNVRTQEQAMRLERQLRLEPGIYQIVNKLQVVNQ